MMAPMRSGIRFESQERQPTRELPEGAHLGEYPILVDPFCPFAEARGRGRKRHLVVGPGWFKLTGGEQWALLWHEVGHHVHRHLAKRLWLLPFFLTGWARNICFQQEMEADRYCANMGYGREMRRFLCTYPNGGDYHPSRWVRLQALDRAINDHERTKNVAA